MLTNDSELKNINKILIDNQISDVFNKSFDRSKINQFIMIPNNLLVSFNRLMNK